MAAYLLTRGGGQNLAKSAYVIIEQSLRKSCGLSVYKKNLKNNLLSRRKKELENSY